MSIIRRILLLVSFAAISICARAGRPVNGTTAFNSVSPGVKAMGNAGTGAGITANDIQGFDFKLTTATSGPTMVIEVWDGFVSSGNGVAFYEQSSGINPLFSGIFISSDDGALFDLQTIGINAQSSGGGDATVTITGLNNVGAPISGASFTGVASVSALTVFNLSSNNAFKNIAAIRITSADVVYAFIDNINLANVGTVLPLTWLDFTTSVRDNQVTLNWSTAIEQGTTNFIVQHSRDGLNWKMTGNTPASGNSSIPKSYNFIHTTPGAGNNYYRLSQTDIYGRQFYSRVMVANIKASSAQLAVYPSIVENGFVNVKLGKKTLVLVFNQRGNAIIIKEMQPGVTPVSINHLTPGVYRVKAGTETGSFLIM